MSGFMVYRKLTKGDAEDLLLRIEQWFKDNPKRRVCRTELFKVRRGHVREDVMEKHAEK